MMIIGIGTDILKIERLQAAYDRTQGRLAEKILGPDEMLVFKARLARNHKRGIAFLATRFAAKEAFSKAIGLGMRMPMTWRSLQTLNEVSGKPVTSYSGALARFMTEKQWQAQVTVSDELDMAIAFVVVTEQN
ncbi:holo-ACP synthase [Polynucleobacter paneuropaeus]|uniref:Holo-[acyl-carrier-protein] synthase n=2 Tax=Polynucleobacter paneuropaeus TaxID=2527775 RepID=A0A9Q2WIJ4_9BURK|nr:holo-ACP synthase [Polynucleobacter paneuropaeus]MBT8516439.1 holo-ACP synthase [Polynucleobacter paneuropaeus]MBT8517985.1 holo-ACP synthase [Polynucleobacter paneuropaeus]MBT8520785.1 holo-ACP synthase [Polynucleobacter paneuropaeus]MBT8522800.1 holo-ACP synthase [Polynucleobacter paneuropaeus]